MRVRVLRDPLGLVSEVVLRFAAILAVQRRAPCGSRYPPNVDVQPAKPLPAVAVVNPSVPNNDAALPEDPIYDSKRSYAENKMRIDRYRGGADRD